VNKAALTVLAALMFSASAGASPMLSGFNTSVLPKCDDCSSSAVNLGFTIDFNDQLFSSVYVNNNGNVTFGKANASYVPEPMFSFRGMPIIAPYFVDVDTTKPQNKDSLGHTISPVQGTVSYGQGYYSGASGLLNVGDYDHAKAFGVTWQNVRSSDLEAEGGFDTFQLLLIENDLKPDAFEVMFNYGSIQWDNHGGYQPPPYGSYGFSDGTGNLYYDGVGSSTAALVDGQSDALNRISHTAPLTAGRQAFLIATGHANSVAVPEPGVTGLLSIGALALLFNRRRRT
jgi:hypothetical protein